MPATLREDCCFDSVLSHGGSMQHSSKRIGVNKPTQPCGHYVLCRWMWEQHVGMHGIWLHGCVSLIERPACLSVPAKSDHAACSTAPCLNAKAPHEQ